MAASGGNKKIKFFILTLAVVILLASCGQKNPPAQEPAGDLPEMSTEELAAFNGKDGQPAYIAVDGVIYDVTEISFWKGGLHNGFQAGKDLTKEIKTVSPHGVSKLKGVPIVGKLVN
jgi:predicted heme/steroid binding protein